MSLHVSHTQTDRYRQTDRQGVVITEAGLEITVHPPWESSVVTGENLEAVLTLLLAHVTSNPNCSSVKS